MALSRTTSRTVWAAVRAVAVFTVLLGVLYPLSITLAGQLAFPAQANGSLVQNSEGHTVGSALIGQPFTTSAGAPDPQFFQPRPSAADYSGTASGGTNLGPENPKLAQSITERRAAIAEFNSVPGSRVPESRVPADAVTASASGLDPHIGLSYALLQVDRVAHARDLSPEAVRALVHAHTTGPDLGFLGETRVNVVELNLALSNLKG